MHPHQSSADLNRLAPVAEETEEPAPDSAAEIIVNEKRRSSRQHSGGKHSHHRHQPQQHATDERQHKHKVHDINHRHMHHHHQQQQTPAVMFHSSNGGPVPGVAQQPHVGRHPPPPPMATVRTQPLHNGVIREQYWVYSCKWLRCSGWSRREQIMFGVLVTLSSTIFVLVILLWLFLREQKQDD